MANGPRYLVFALIDYLLAGFVFYRSLLTVINGDAKFTGSTGFSIVLMIALLAMAIRFSWLAKKRWGE